MFKVMKERCNQCLYGPNKIVSDERRKQILKDIHDKDDYFICHKATLKGTKACCRGDWDARGAGQSGRLARRLEEASGAKLVRFVEESEL